MPWMGNRSAPQIAAAVTCTTASPGSCSRGSATSITSTAPALEALTALIPAPRSRLGIRPGPRRRYGCHPLSSRRLHSRRAAVCDGLLQLLCWNPDMGGGQLGSLLHITQPDGRQDRAVLGHRSVQAAAQRQGPRLESPDFAGQPAVHLHELRIAAQLANQFVKRDVRAKELRDIAVLGALRHPIDEQVEVCQLGIGDPRYRQPDGQDLQRLSDLVGVDEFRWRDRPYLGAPPGPHRDEPLRGQPAHGLPDWSTAHVEFLGQRDLGELGARREPVPHDLVPQVLVDPLPQCQILECRRHTAPFAHRRRTPLRGSIVLCMMLTGYSLNLTYRRKPNKRACRASALTALADSPGRRSPAATEVERTPPGELQEGASGERT